MTGFYGDVRERGAGALEMLDDGVCVSWCAGQKRTIESDRAAGCASGHPSLWSRFDSCPNRLGLIDQYEITGSALATTARKRLP